MMNRSAWISVVVLASAFLSACDLFAPKTPPATAPTASASPELTEGEVAKRAKANAELLREVHEVVFMEAPKDRAEFGSYVDTLNQGASIEGVYNGFIHSAHYRRFEVMSGEAPVEVIRVFAEELAHLEVALPAPTEFDSNSAKPLPMLAPNELNQPARVIEFPEKGKGHAAEQAKPDEAALARKYEQIFKGASVFTLKRVLGDEIMKVIAASGANLPAWYGKWVVRMAGRNVDFGLSLRNRADEGFHSGWVKSVTEDRVKWEALNRVHRVMNDVYRKKRGQS